MGWIVSGFLFSSVSVVNLVVGGWVGGQDGDDSECSFLFSSVSVVNLVVDGWVGRMDTIVSVVCFLSLA